MRVASGIACLGALGLTLSSVQASAMDSAKEQAKIRKMTFDYAKCVVRKHHAKASEAILATASNSAILKDFGQIIDSECLGKAVGYNVEMRFPKDSYRFALADALVNADFAQSGPTSFDDRLPLAQPADVAPEAEAALLAKAKSGRARKAIEADIAAANMLTAMSRYGECVVRKDPVNARFWLLTPPNVPEEESRIKVLGSAFGDCLGPGKVKINRVIMRGTVAINYYRLAMATVVPRAGSAQ